MPEYLVYSSNSHTDFRKEELESLAHLHGINVSFEGHDQSSPFHVITLKDDLEATKLVARSILTRGVYEVLSIGSTYEALHTNLKAHNNYPFPRFGTSSFKFTLEAFESTKTHEQQREVIDSFRYLPWTGPIEMRNPEFTFTIFEEWTPKSQHGDPQRLLRVFFARYITGTSRHLVTKFDLKKRGYLGTTSMEAELSLISANQVLAQLGRLIYDPFVGTGSFLLTSSAFGAMSIGSDIDGRQIKGKGRTSITSNFDQYELQHLLLDCLVFDIKHPPLHRNFRVDGIIADPPYGVRAGAKTLGRAPGTRLFGRTSPSLMPNGQFVHTRDNYVPPKKPYELSDLADDLLDYAAKILVDGGRLVFWLPTVNEDYSTVDLPQRSDMQLLANSTQNFGRWSRRLLTYAKKGQLVEPGRRLERMRQPGHLDFRHKYYSRFGDGREVDQAAYDKLSLKDREFVKLRSEE